MPFPTRHRFRRGSLAALLACLALTPLLAGCAEDRSNLIPADVSESVIAKINEAEELAAQGNCFDAQEVAAEAQTEIESLGGNIDPELKRSLVDGVVRLQGLLGDPEVCQDSSTVETVDPVETEEPPTDTEGTTGVTGTTDSGTTTTGDQGPTTDDEQNSGNNQGNGNGNQTSGNNPRPNPTPPTTPTQPTTPTTPTNPPTGPGSGGLGPG